MFLLSTAGTTGFNAHTFFSILQQLPCLWLHEKKKEKESSYEFNQQL
jgi:hypothetical protein